MASFMIKIAGEGLVAPAHRLADPGPTSGSALIYQIDNVPDGVTVEEVVKVFKAFKAPDNRFEIDYSELTTAG